MMKFTRLEIPEIILCETTLHKDDRGYFSETLRHDKLESFLGYDIKFIQENETESSYGVIRGLHFQQSPNGQTKLVRVINGSVLDVVVDVRENSSTFGKHISVNLSSKNKNQLLSITTCYGITLMRS